MEQQLVKPTTPTANNREPEVNFAQVHAAIADRVRTDSGSSRPTRVDILLQLVPEPQKLQPVVAAMMSSETYLDIKLLAAADGVKYLYCETALSRQDAERFVLGEEARSQIAARVRDTSSRSHGLTSITSLGSLILGAETDKIDEHLSVLLSDDRYKDLRLLTNSRGNRYLYSEAYMTHTYAEILARAEAKDPCETLAATVRQDSRVYPRPTSLEAFKAPVFGINPDDLGMFVSEMTTQPRYEDIKLVKASNGAVYLYSSLYLEPEWVKATVEWQEVERYLNP